MKPPLVVVAGPPGTGKTRLAAPLASELGLPLVAKDTVKEALMDALGADSLERSVEMGGASFAVCLALAADQIATGIGVVVEGAFFRDWMERQLPPLFARSRPALVACNAPADVLLARWRDRAGARHPGHHDHDHDRLAGLAERVRTGAYDVPNLGVPCLRVDTSAGPALNAILLWIRSRWL